LESVQGLEKRYDVEVRRSRWSRRWSSGSSDRPIRALDGFRPGKAPLRVVRQRFGDQARREAYGELIETSFQQAATQEKLRVVAQPRIELKDVEGARLATSRPSRSSEVTLATSAGGDRRPTASVQECGRRHVMIESLRRQRTSWVEVERAAREGDTVQISFKGTVDGEASRGLGGPRPLTLGSGSMIPGSSPAWWGMSTGEVRPST